MKTISVGHSNLDFLMMNTYLGLIIQLFMFMYSTSKLLLCYRYHFLNTDNQIYYSFSSHFLGKIVLFASVFGYYFVLMFSMKILFQNDQKLGGRNSFKIKNIYIYFFINFKECIYTVVNLDVFWHIQFFFSFVFLFVCHIVDKLVKFDNCLNCFIFYFLKKI